MDTAELSSKTMESLKVKGLSFTGEVVDVTGHLGGLKFQWAWGVGRRRRTRVMKTTKDLEDCVLRKPSAPRKQHIPRRDL
ncbi:MAG: hypothetical protein DMG49_20815 [Acidobacteria bacterium]|nr:MAG: hypothetical protein DMG49_20815 [Acidobacteriota bacterium]